jgi:hypothetical protein
LDLLVWRKGRGRVLRDRVRILGVLDRGLEVEKKGSWVGMGRKEREERTVRLVFLHYLHYSHDCRDFAG